MNFPQTPKFCASVEEEYPIKKCQQGNSWMKKMSENMPKSELFQEDRKYFKQNDYFCDHKFREDRIKSFRFFQNRKYFFNLYMFKVRVNASHIKIC